MMRAAQLFNPLRAKNMTPTWMTARVEELKSFKFPEFIRGKMLSGIKKEHASYTNLLKWVFDWDVAIPGASEYNKKLEKKEATNGEEEETTTWMDDPKEVARRVWEWWVIHNHHFIYLSKAVRLVALVQTSSAAAERTFSQLGLILDAVGVVSLGDSVELRLFERVNRNLYGSL
jgi:hypothetical protein